MSLKICKFGIFLFDILRWEIYVVVRFFSERVKYCWGFLTFFFFIFKLRK